MPFAQAHRITAPFQAKASRPESAPGKKAPARVAAQVLPHPIPGAGQTTIHHHLPLLEPAGRSDDPRPLHRRRVRHVPGRAGRTGQRHAPLPPL